MRKILNSFLFVSLCILITSCGKQAIDLPIVEVESTMAYAAKFASGVEATQAANHVDTYIDDCPDADFAELLQDTNNGMAFTGFNYFDESTVYTTDDVLFYPVLRNSERNSGFLNMCIPFYRFSETSSPTLLLEGPGVVAIGILTDLYEDDDDDIRSGGNIIPLVSENPGFGSFETGYATSYRTANGRVVIDYDRNGFENEGTLRIVVESSDVNASLDKTWLIKF